MKRTLKLATVFSGIGSIEHALKQLKINTKIVFACDNGERVIKETKEEITKYIYEHKLSQKQKNEYVKKLYQNTKKENYVKKTYMANYSIKENDWYEDIRFLDGTEYKDSEIDLFVGGSPCQSFSISGRRAGLEDARGTLFYEFARLVKEIQPKVFIYENVPGLLNHDKGNTFKIISDIFDSLGYVWSYKKINAKDQGIPQNRLRVFVVGFRKDLKINNFVFPKNIKLVNTVNDYLEENPSLDYFLGEKGFKWCTSVKSLKKRVSINEKIARTEAANQQFNWCGDKVFYPVEELNFVPNSKIYIGNYKGQKGVLRKLTPRECLRLMGYDDDFAIVVDDKNIYRQAGNSIVVNCMKSLFNEIVKTGVYDD